MTITKDGDHWIVYDPYHDYMAQGKTRDEALNNFIDGLVETLKLKNKLI